MVYATHKEYGHRLRSITESAALRVSEAPTDVTGLGEQESDSVVWGILTNGEVWRLSCRDSKASHYFALNFEVAIKSLL